MHISFLRPAWLWILAVAICSACETQMHEATMSIVDKKDIQPPKCVQRPKELTIHGDTRIDKYYWLRERDNPEVIAYLEAENAYTDTMMSHLKPFQEQLFEEMKSRIKERDVSVPAFKNGYWYYTRYEEGKEYPIYCRKRGSLEAIEEVMLDVNELAASHDYYHVNSLSVSPDNKWLAFGEDTLSRRQYTIRFRNLETGEFLPQRILNTTGSAVWAADSKTIFYTAKEPETLRAYKVLRHQLGTDPTQDVEVFHEADETFVCGVGKTRSEKYILIGSWQTVSSEYRYLPADQPHGQWQVFEPRQRNLEYDIDHHTDGKWYVRTNLDAKNFRLMETSEGATGRAHWKEVVPHRSDVLLESVEIFKDFLVLEERIKGITHLRIWPLASDMEAHTISFRDDAYVAYVDNNPEFDQKQVRIGYQSMTTPPTVYDYNPRTRQLDLKKQQEVLGGFSPDDYVSERLYALARDGVEVPITLVYRKGFTQDGSAPLLLYGYGSYGYSLDPSFSTTRLSLLDRGFVYAIAHVRGGSELGRQWYEDGKLLKKKNTFFDFIDCATYLLEQSYTSKGKLYAMGGSAGGLLMGAVVNFRPDLWKGVVAAVPFVDVLTTMLDESIPLTTGEFDEWGDPKIPEYYWYMKSYSPYDNVSAQDYPAMLVTTGLHDSQVQYWEPAKWVAKLRELKTDHNPLLLYTNMEAGHGGASGRFRRLREVAMEYAFLLDLAGKVQ